MTDESTNMNDERRQQLIDAWKAVVDVQKHFNDISIRIRGMFITLLLALFASIGFLLDKKIGFQVGKFNIQFAVVMPLFGLFGTWLFYFLDRYWYHRLLVGSVKHAMNIEQRYKKEIPELSLTEAIGAESPYEPTGVTRWLANCIVRHPKYRDDRRLHSDGKLEFFYKSVMMVLVLTALLVASFGGIDSLRHSELAETKNCATAGSTTNPATVSVDPSPVSVDPGP